MSVFQKARASNAGGDFPQCPPAMWRGCLLGLIDLGTHWQSFQGQEERKVRRWLFVFEVEAEKEGQLHRFFLGRDFNLSIADDGCPQIGKKSNLRAMLEGWRGKPYGDKEAVFPDPAKILGRACLINVIHEEVKGKHYARIESVKPLVLGMQPLQPSRPLILYDADSDDEAPGQDDEPGKTEWLPRVYGQRVHEVLTCSLEWGGDGRRGKGGSGQAAGENAAPQQGAESFRYGANVAAEAEAAF